jgi:hypothetical protein
MSRPDSAGIKYSDASIRLIGSGRSSIDADSRKSKWRITFTWENDEAKDVCLVKIEDTH